MSNIKKVSIGFLAPIILVFFLFTIIIGAGIGLLQGQTSDCDGSGSVTQLSGDTTSGTDKQLAQAAFNALKSLGYSSAAAAGVIGNLQWESGGHFKVNAQEESGGGGWGLPQFTGSTLVTAKITAAAHHYNMNSVEGQIQTLDYMCQHGDWIANGTASTPPAGVSYSDFKHTNDPSKAAYQFCWGFERPGSPHLSERQQYAKAWYAAFGSGNDKTTQVAQDFASANGNTTSTDACDIGGSDSSGGSGDILDTAKKLVGYFTYSQPNRRDVAKSGKSLNSLKSVDDVKKSGQTDCSGFVWLVLKLAGYKVPSDMGWYTGSMAADARGARHWLKEVDAKDAKAGDVVIVNQGGGAGSAGHTAILMENWHGNSTKVIEMGGLYTETHVNAGHTFQESFLSLLDGGDICFAEPIK